MTGAGIIKFLASTGVISPVYFSICYAMVEESIKRSLRRLCFYKCLSVHGGGCLPQCMLGYTPREQTTPLRSACWEIRATSGRYASYWNVYLYLLVTP